MTRMVIVERLAHGHGGLIALASRVVVSAELPLTASTTTGRLAALVTVTNVVAIPSPLVDVDGGETLPTIPAGLMIENPTRTEAEGSAPLWTTASTSYTPCGCFHCRHVTFAGLLLPLIEPDYGPPAPVSSTNTVFPHGTGIFKDATPAAFGGII